MDARCLPSPSPVGPSRQPHILGHDMTGGGEGGGGRIPRLRSRLPRTASVRVRPSFLPSRSSRMLLRTYFCASGSAAAGVLFCREVVLGRDGIHFALDGRVA